ncbi:hypothetical protein N0B16_01735 [Chryseobacterium sp. GMJ5]|uniref:Orphan protein n=1 Tax=Chryseobacterium gilvum TaxID=2976534 RepID=A0ABT2VT28_9FLAO|nr:hypothetical protein [Chryseobacterium gilvum]MCU7613143.1 hypothetical protein [Chryseobacterium gilvum]
MYAKIILFLFFTGALMPVCAQYSEANVLNVRILPVQILSLNQSVEPKSDLESKQFQNNVPESGMNYLTVSHIYGFQIKVLQQCSEEKQIPTVPENTCYKAVALTQINTGVAEKKIPVAYTAIEQAVKNAACSENSGTPLMVYTIISQ